jgi:hypothetical protein
LASIVYIKEFGCSSHAHVSSNKRHNKIIIDSCAHNKYQCIALYIVEGWDSGDGVVRGGGGGSAHTETSA